MTPPQPHNPPNRWMLVGIAVVALALRLLWVLVIRPNPPLLGGDAPAYLAAGQALAGSGPVYWPALANIGPLYPFFLSLFYRLLPEAVLPPAIRISQSILDTATCLIAFDLGRRLFNTKVGLLAASFLAVDLRLIVQVNEITTETLFIFLFTAGIWTFIIARETKRSTHLLGATTLLVFAAFTRAIALPIPLLLNASLLLPKPSRKQFLVVSSLVGLVVIGVAGWSIRQYQMTGQWVIVSDGFGSNFWMGSRGNGQWNGSVQFQNDIDDLKQRYNGRTAYLEDSFKTIAADPAAYSQLLLTKVTQAYLQPHGTVSFPGESLKDLAVKTVRGEISLGELIAGEAFWPKLYIYLFHFTGLVGGLIAMWLTRHNWLKMLPVTLPIVYLSVTYTLLTIIPRYIFPIMPLYMLLAAYTLSRLRELRKN